MGVAYPSFAWMPVFRQNAEWLFCFMSWSASIVVRRSSSTTKWAASMSQEWFDLESPNFTLASYTDPFYSRTGYDITSYFWSDVIRRLLVEFLESGLSEDHEILQPYLGNWASHICTWYDVASCFRLAGKKCKWTLHKSA